MKACNHTLDVRVLDVIRTQTKFSVGVMLALAEIESDGDWRKKSDKGAIGVWQIMPIHAYQRHIALADLEDPIVNCRIALEVLKEMAERYNDVAYHYISAYNCGTRMWDRVMKGKENPSRETDAHWQKYRRALKKYTDWLFRGEWNDDRCYQ